MPNLVLTCSGLVKHFEQGDTRVEVLNGVDLQIAAGERIAIVGASGSGKTTLLQLLGGLDLPTAGAVTIAGKEINRLSDAERGELRNRAMGFVYQFHHLLPEFTALENVMMPGWIAGRSTAAARERAESLLSDLGLTARAEHKPAELSGGEQQRVAVARALHLRPWVLLADEPTGNLDRSATGTLLEIFEKYRQEERQAIVIATHNMEVARAAGRAVTLEDGVLRPMNLSDTGI
jgi:lipoprotein-releasing system ATP-binding protein